MTDSARLKSKKTTFRIYFLFLLLLIGVCTCVFGYTVEVRKPWYGILSPGNHQWLTAAVLLYLENWWEEGAWATDFRMIDNPASIEFESMDSRFVYASGPPGSLIPPYFLAWISRIQPSLSLIMSWNLANHLMIALLLGFLAFLFLLSLGTGPLDCFLLSLIPMLLELLLPGPMYSQQNVFFGPQAIILPFVLVVFLEFLLDKYLKGKGRGWIQWLQYAVFFYGYLTEWPSFLVGLAIYSKRVFEDKIPRFEPRLFIRRTLDFWAPAILAMGLYSLQLMSHGGFKWLWKRFLVRTGIGAPPTHISGNFETQFWGGHMGYYFGRPLTWMLLLSVAIIGLLWIFREKAPRSIQKILGEIAGLCFLLFSPALAYTYLLLDSCFIHNFEALKFSPSVAFIPLLLMPLAVFVYFFTPPAGKALVLPSYRLWNVSIPVFSLALTGLCFLALWQEYPRYRELFPVPDYRMVEIGTFIKSNTSYREVVFSPTFEIPMYPPHYLSISRKRVYRFFIWNQLIDRVRNLPEECTVDILVFKGNNPIPWKILNKFALQTAQKDDLFLFKFPKNFFTEKGVRKILNFIKTN